MGTKYQDSSDQNPQEEANEPIAWPRPGPRNNPPSQKIGWIKQDRRRPENALIRRWMELADKLLGR